MKEIWEDRLGMFCFRVGCWFITRCFSHVVFKEGDGPIHLVVFATDRFHIDQFAESWYKENELARNVDQTV